MTVELVVAAAALTGECPVWDDRLGVLWWVDIPGRLVHRHDAAGGTDSVFATPGRPGCVAVRERGGLVLGLDHDFSTCEFDGSAMTRIAEIERDRPGNRVNDGACDARGRLWAGTMDDAEVASEAAALYRLDPDGSATAVIDQVTLSNGIGWSPDHRLMYYVDTPTRRIDVMDFDLDAGTVSGRRPFAVMEPGAGYPDGLCVDAEGAVWIALWGGWAVRRYLPDGSMERVIELPCSQVSCVTFGGASLDILYVTTATKNLSTAELTRQPAAGGLFRCRPGVRGLAAHRFGG